MVCDGEVDVCEDLQLEPGESESFYFTACPGFVVNVLAQSSERIEIRMIRLREATETVAATATVPTPFGFGFRHCPLADEQLIFRATNTTPRIADAQIQIRVGPEPTESSSMY